MSAFLNRAQVAAELKITVQYFQEIRAGELKEKGFPDPTFGTRQNERWDLEAVDAWRRSQIPPELRAVEPGPQDPEAAAAAELDRRAEALARREKVH